MRARRIVQPLVRLCRVNLLLRTQELVNYRPMSSAPNAKRAAVEAPKEGPSVDDVLHEEMEEQFVLRDSDGNAMAYVTYEKNGICGGRSVEEGKSCGVLDLQHTVSDPKYRGRGLAGLVVEAAFRYASEHGLKVLPTCSYVHGTFLVRRPEWQSLSLTPAGQPPIQTLSAAAAAEELKGEEEDEEEDDDDEEEEEEGRQRRLVHGFQLAYDQRAGDVYEKGTKRVRPDAEMPAIARLGALVVSRAIEVDNDGEMLTEGANLFGVCMSRARNNVWRDTYGVEDALAALERLHIDIPMEDSVPEPLPKPADAGTKRSRP